jgi:DNA-binding IclR family transcriptional regulator
MPDKPPIPGLAHSSEFAGDRQFATNLSRGLEVLRAFTPDSPVLGNRDIADRTGLPKATVSRLTYTLMLLGYLGRVEPLQKYRLGAGVLSLGYPLLASMPVRQLARGRMERLAEQTGCTVNLGMRDRLNVVYIDTCRGDRSNSYQPDIGSTGPLLTTAIGRALLLGSPAAERTAILNRLKVDDPRRFAADAPRWERDARQFASRGFCLSKGDWRRDVYAIAVPIRQPLPQERVALNCTMSAHRLRSRDAMEREFAPLLLEAARDVEAASGIR